MVSEPSSMEARVCKLEAQVIELGIKMDTQFQATEKSVEKLMVTMSSLENEMFSFRDEVMEALGLNKSPTLVPDEELGNLAGDSESVKIAGDSKEVKTNRGVEAPMLYAVIENPTIVDNPDIPSYQPHTHGRCDPPALIPLQMNGCSLEADCYLDTASLTFTGSWRMHCVKGSKSCDCHIAIPMGEQGSIRSVEVEETPGKYANPRRTNVEWAPMREQLKEQQPRKFAETHLMRYMADFSLFDDDQPRLWVSGLETSKLLNNGEIVEGFEGGLYNCGTQVGSLAVVDVVRMELSGTSNVSDELITKQENNVTLLEYFLIGFLVFNHLGNYGYIEGVDIKTTFDPGGMLKIIVLGLVIFLNPKDIDEIKHEALLESNKEAIKRRKIYGPNEFEMHEGLSIFRLMLDQFIDTLVRILLVAVVILFVLAWYDRDEGGEIGSLIGEYNVVADMRVVSLINSTLSLEQGSLNGGGEAVSKTTEAVPEEVDIQGKICMVLASTTVVNGNCIGLVTQTGMSTGIGIVHSLIHEASKNEENTLLKKKLNEFGEYLTAIIGVICALVWLINVKYFLSWESLMDGIGILRSALIILNLLLLWLPFQKV